MNEIVGGGGILVNSVLNSKSGGGNKSGHINTVFESLEDLAIPIGLDSHYEERIVEREGQIEKIVAVVPGNIFDSLFESIQQKKNKRNTSTKRKTIRKG
jgi:hypothetical protein